MKAKVLFGTTLVLAVISLIAETQRISPRKDLIHRKLDHAQRVLEGIALENFEMIADSATQLGALSQEATWRASGGQEYAEQTAIFRRNVEALKKAAGERDVDRAALAYTKLMFSCVECHKYMREREGDQGIEEKTLSEQLVEPPPDMFAGTSLKSE